MSHPQYPGIPYYAYYNPSQQVYYPYGYPHHPYASAGIYMAPVHPPPSQIDPALLTGQAAQPGPSTAPASKKPPSSSPASYNDDDDDDGEQQQFALHPVGAQKAKVSPPVKAEGNENVAEDDEDEDGEEGYAEVDTGQTNVAPVSSTDPAPSLALEQATSSRKAPGPIGEVTGAPKPEDAGALSADEIAKFNSPVKALNHIEPDLFPSRAVFENILYTYQSNLSARKRNKALISRAAYAEIQMTLVEIRESKCRRGTAQYRFWVKKMFGLINFYGHDVVGHQGKPVAIREDIYDILVHCHDQCDHGGRDRTVEVVKDFYVSNES